MNRLILLFLFVPCLSTAQIEVNTGDLPSANDTIRYTQVFGVGIDELGLDNTGPNVTWDYSWLDSEVQEVDSFLNVWGAPFLYQFFFNNQFLYPESWSNLATATDDIDLGGFSLEDPWEFYRNDDSAFVATGFGITMNSLPFSVPFEGVEVINDFPMNYGNNDSSAFVSNLEIPELLTWIQTGTRQNWVDGWGTLITPQDTYQVLRQRSLRLITDSTYIDLLGFGTNFPRPDEYVYTWTAQGHKAPIMEVRTQVFFGEESVSSIKFQDDVPEVIIDGIDEQASEFVIYPNPATDLVYIQSNLGQSFQVRLLNESLSEVWNGRITSGEPIDLGTLPAGFYLIEMTDERGLSTIKPIIVQ